MTIIIQGKEYIKETCIECGVDYFVPTTMHKYKKDNKKNLYCPSGHSQAYIKSRADILEEELAIERSKNLRKDTEIRNLEKALSNKTKKPRKKLKN